MTSTPAAESGSLWTAVPPEAGGPITHDDQDVPAPLARPQLSREGHLLLELLLAQRRQRLDEQDRSFGQFAKGTRDKERAAIRDVEQLLEQVEVLP